MVKLVRLLRVQGRNMPFLPSAVSLLRPAPTPPERASRAFAPRARQALWRAWSAERSPTREYVEVILAVSVVSAIGWLEPVGYRAFGHVYLLAVIGLSARVGRWPALFAAVLSALAWDYVIIPPRMSFSTLELEDEAILGTYFVAALIAGQLTARIREQELAERRRQRRATALYHFSRALAEAHTLDEAVAAALLDMGDLFGVQAALLLADEPTGLTLHPASTLTLGLRERAVADWVSRHGRPAGHGTGEHENAEALHLPLVRAGGVLGVLVVERSDDSGAGAREQRELIAAFAAQIALMVEREKLRAASEREALSAESDRLHRTLLDSVSHELKTPLAVLRTAAENLATADPARQPILHNEIRTATGRLDRLVANLLDQTRLESGAIRPQLDCCDARDLVNTARRALGDALAGRVVKLAIPEELPLLMADARLMEQVITNLLLNATLHTPAGTPIQISAGVEPGGARGFIAVIDRGPGIAAEVREHLFEKFRRGEKARAGGVGLGLSIVRGFMLAQGGEITAENPPGGGARFTVYLPRAAHSFVPNE